MADGSAVNYSIVPRNDGKEVLVVSSGQGWSLPEHQHSAPHEITTELASTLGLAPVVTGTVQELAGPGGQSTVFAHENSDDPLPDGARWVGKAELASLPMPIPEVRTVLADWFASVDTANGPLPRVSWVQDGWFAQAAAWMVQRLGENGVEVAGPVEQFHTSPWSCILRVPTGDGHAYLKAAPDVFGYEADLTRTIGEWFPNNVVPVLAVDSARGWLLSADIGPNTDIDPVTTRADLPAYQRSVVRYAQIQREAINQLSTVAKLGVPDRRLAVLPELFDDLLSDTDVLMVGREGGLSVDEHARLRGFAGQFAQWCARLAEFDLPETLVNIDFWHGNLSFRTVGDVIFDWAESAITHPMFSLITVIREFEVHDLPDGDELCATLVDTYLDQWRDRESEQRLREAYRLAQPGAILCRAQCWRDSISSLTEPRRYRKHRRAVALNIARMLPYIEGGTA